MIKMRFQIEKSYIRDVYTKLHISFSQGQLEVVKYLWEHQNINKEATDNEGLTPLHICCSNGQLEIVKYLCEEQYINRYSNF